ncbi:gamma-glutamylcyclotransferase [Oceaniglobus roseus]|uniref:gamma-glutamylcyclotransferase n=1 Tax=Oceaniglobus roseus TaxID=1737570 RepID=UPI000C7F4825|nr:gamma-glutamylcyclotransferase [Kandeliimicrobium roseum]
MNDPAPPPLPRLSLTRSHVARVHREIADGIQEPRLTLLSEAGMERAAQSLARSAGRGDFWVFTYGSLIWKPAFDTVERRIGMARGWRRAFCLDMHSWRATPEQPGLMLALTEGGSCTGAVYRMPEGDPLDHMRRLLEREVDHVEALPWIRWLTVETAEGPLRALAFYCTPLAGNGLIHLPLPRQTERLARAVGPKGSCAEYLLNTVEALAALDIRDDYLWELQHSVADEIDRLFPPA